MHFNNLLELDTFIRQSFSLVCSIRNLPIENYNLVYDYSITKRFGLFRFPCTIILYVSNLKEVGYDIDSNKTFIFQIIVHELYHSTQNISIQPTEEMEYAADYLTNEFLIRYKDQIESTLNFKIDEETKSFLLSSYNKSIEFNYIEASNFYVYNTLLRLIPFYTEYDKKAVLNILEERLRTSKDFTIRISDLFTHIFTDFIIKSNYQFLDPSMFRVAVFSNILSKTYIKCTYVSSNTSLTIMIFNYYTNPIKIGK